MEHFLFTSNDGIWGKQVQGRQMRKEVQVFLCKTWSEGSSTQTPRIRAHYTPHWLSVEVPGKQF